MRRHTPASYDETTQEATDVALGILRARLTGRADDAAMLLMSYIQDVIKAGHTTQDAMSALYTASSRWNSYLLEALAAERGESADDLLVTLALERAVRRSL